MRWLALALLAACGPHDVESVAFGDGGRPPTRGTSCQSNDHCQDFEFCEMNTCDENSGFCKPRTCTPGAPVGGPVCGCDGRNYADNCERRRAAVSGFFPGMCP